MNAPAAIQRKVTPDDVLIVRVEVYLTLRARLEVLLSGRARVESRTPVDVIRAEPHDYIRAHETSSAFVTWFPWGPWLARRKMVGMGEMESPRMRLQGERS